MAAEIRLFPCLTDNFGYLIHDPVTKATASIDAPEAAPVIAALEREGWTLTDILITHHHGDHVGGVAELKQKYKCRVIAPHDKSAKIANVDTRVAHGDVVKIGGLLARVLETPGHTLDHVSYVFDSEKALFAADTLFSIGCGRVFEGTYPQMWDSLLKLRVLPDDFKLYCGHEYTAANVKFALTVEPDNAALKARAEEVTRLRAANQADHPGNARRRKKSQCVPARRRAVGRRQRADERQKWCRGVRRIARTQEQILMRSPPPISSPGSASSRIRKAAIIAKRFVTRAATPMDVRARRRSISCWRAMSGRIGIALMLSKSGIITPAARCLLQIADGDGRRALTLGPDLAAGEVPQASCPRMPGRQPKAPATGRWWDAPSRRDLTLQLRVGAAEIGSLRTNSRFRNSPLPRSNRRRRSRPRRSQGSHLAWRTPPDQKPGRKQRRRIGRRTQYADIAALHSNIPGVKRRADGTDPERRDRQPLRHVSGQIVTSTMPCTAAASSAVARQKPATAVVGTDLSLRESTE